MRIMSEVEDNKIYIDGTGLVLGRLSSWIANKVLQGDEVVVVNAQDVIITGGKRKLIKDYTQTRARATHTNPAHGPMFPRFPDRILRRTVRGMLPWKKTRGREAFRRLAAFIEIPDELSEKEFITVESAKFRGYRDHMTVGELARRIGWQHGEIRR